MRQSKFTETQIVSILKEAEAVTQSLQVTASPSQKSQPSFTQLSNAVDISLTIQLSTGCTPIRNLLKTVLLSPAASSLLR